MRKYISELSIKGQNDEQLRNIWELLNRLEVKYNNTGSGTKRKASTKSTEKEIKKNKMIGGCSRRIEVDVAFHGIKNEFNNSNIIACLQTVMHLDLLRGNFNRNHVWRNMQKFSRSYYMALLNEAVSLEQDLIFDFTKNPVLSGYPYYADEIFLEKCINRNDSSKRLFTLESECNQCESKYKRLSVVLKNTDNCNIESIKTAMKICNCDTRNFKIITAPVYLLIHIDRNNSVPAVESQMILKHEIIIGQQIYKLHVIFAHAPSTEIENNWICFVKRRDIWYKCCDNSITTVNFNSLCDFNYIWTAVIYSDMNSGGKIRFLHLAGKKLAI